MFTKKSSIQKDTYTGYNDNRHIQPNNALGANSFVSFNAHPFQLHIQVPGYFPLRKLTA